MLSITLAASGCSIFNIVADDADENELEYESVTDKAPPLDVPPDLTGPVTDGRYVVPDLNPSESKTYSAYSKELANGQNESQHEAFTSKLMMTLW